MGLEKHVLLTNLEAHHVYLHKIFISQTFCYLTKKNILRNYTVTGTPLFVLQSHCLNLLQLLYIGFGRAGDVLVMLCVNCLILKQVSRILVDPLLSGSSVMFNLESKLSSDAARSINLPLLCICTFEYCISKEALTVISLKDEEQV